MTENRPEWFYDEFQNSGVNYQDPDVVERYEGRHANFRDFAAEARRMLARLGQPDDFWQEKRLVDLGCGTGALTMEFAPVFGRIDAADVSDGMLGVFRRKLADRRMENVFLHHDGFLTYDHEGEPADVVFSSIAFHHLPDFWKVCALERIHRFLKPGGLFYLTDVVFHFGVDRWREGASEVLAAMSDAAGHEASLHLSREFSSFDWLVEAMFEKTGFAIEKTFDETPFLRTYLCRTPTV